MLNNKIQNYTGGFSMVETLVALTVLVIIGTAIISLVLGVISANNSAKLNNQGVAYAEEGIEQIRGYFQTNGWQTLAAKGNNPGLCYPDGTSNSLTGSPISCPTAPPYLQPNCLQGQTIGATIFGRFVLINTVGSQVKVSSVVTWVDRGGCRNNQVDTYFYSY